MSDLIERLHDDLDNAEDRIEELEKANAQLNHDIGEYVDKTAELEAHYERIKSQTCLCRFNKDEGEGEPSTTPSIECEYHRGLRAENERLRGDLEVMRLQRDATHVSRCPNCKRLTAVYEAAKDYLSDHSNESEQSLFEALAAVKENDDE